MDWIEAAGYNIKRIKDYGEWFAKFKAALETLDKAQQANSSLPIIYQWEQPLSQTPELKCAPPLKLLACVACQGLEISKTIRKL